MKSADLLEILNSVHYTSEIAAKLSEAGFAVNDFTEEGESVFHILARTRHAKEINFYSYLNALIALGGNPNALDKQGRSFLGYYMEAASYYLDSNLKQFFRNNCVDVQQKIGSDGLSLFEYLCSSHSYSIKDLYQDLLRHPGFDVNQKTSTHNSVLLHLICEMNLSDGHQIGSIITNPKADINVQDTNGKTALGYILSTDTYKNTTFISNFFSHPQFDINISDNEGNNYLQLAVLHCSVQADEIAKLLVQNGIDVAHRNYKGQSVFDLILENKARRSEYANNVILLEILKLHPASLLGNYANGNSILSALIKSKDYTIQSELTTLLQLASNQEEFDVNALDSEGNNYLQLAIRSKANVSEIAKVLIPKGINLSHKNNNGQSIFDLILVKKYGLIDDSSHRLMIDIIKLQPSAILETSGHGISLLSTIFRNPDRSISSEFPGLLQLCKSLPTANEFIKKLMTECLADFEAFNSSSEEFEVLIQGLISAKIDIDVEYFIALTVTASSTFRTEEAIKNLKKIKPDVDLNKVLDHINSLTTEGSAERKKAAGYINTIGVPLDCFDSNVLAWEEEFLRKKRGFSLVTDSSMFGHLFSLSGYVPVNNKLQKLTSSLSYDTAPFMVHLINAYVSHCERSGTNSEELEALRQVRNMTVKAMRYFFLTHSWLGYSAKTDDVMEAILADSRSTGVEIITGWAQHAVDLIFKQDNYYRNNGGGCSTDSTTEVYRITRPEQLTESVLNRLFKCSSSEENKIYIQQELHNILGLELSEKSGDHFQTVGNCGLFSQLIALRTKYRLFLPQETADRIYEDSINFFEQFYLDEYIARYAKSPTLPHLLMRLIQQKLLVEDKLDIAAKLINEHFTSEDNQTILKAEFMLKRWLLIARGKSTEKLDRQLKALNVVLEPGENKRLQILDRFLNDKVTADDLDEIKSWPVELQTFQGYHLLHIAVVNDNLSLASSVLTLFPNAVNLKNWFSDKPLCLVQSVAMIDLLLKAGATVDKANQDNALDNATQKNRPDLVLHLLQKGAKPSEYTAYYAATRNPRILKALIKHHPTAIPKTTHSYRAAVHAAANGGHTENLHSLIYYGGAHPAAVDVNGITPLYLALQEGHIGTARHLLEYPGIMFPRTHRGDSLVEKVKDDEELKQAIIAKGKEEEEYKKSFDLFKKSEPGRIEEDIDYLILAIRLDKYPALRGALLAFPKENVFRSSSLYCTSPLQEAIRALPRKRNKQSEYDQAFELIKTLLKTPGINMNAVTSSSEPHLFWATSVNEPKVLELFLAEEELDPNQQDNVGYTALHDAVERGHLECVKRLLNDGRVDISIKNNNGKTAAELEGFSNRVEVAQCREAILEHQLSTQPALSLPGR